MTASTVSHRQSRPPILPAVSPLPLARRRRRLSAVRGTADPDARSAASVRQPAVPSVVRSCAARHQGPGHPTLLSVCESVQSAGGGGGLPQPQPTAVAHHYPLLPTALHYCCLSPHHRRWQPKLLPGAPAAPVGLASQRCVVCLTRRVHGLMFARAHVERRAEPTVARQSRSCISHLPFETRRRLQTTSCARRPHPKQSPTQQTTAEPDCSAHS